MKEIQNLGIVIVAAGSSRRFGQKDKLMLLLNDVPMFLNCISTFTQIIPAENLVIVTTEERIGEFKDLIAKYLKYDIKVIPGGSERKDSSLNGLLALPQHLHYAAVHDAARPYITLSALEDCYETLTKKGSAVLAHPVTDTIKVVNSKAEVVDTPPRNTLYAAETPQMFIKDQLINAYQNPPEGVAITDEAMAMEEAGHRVCLVIHEEDNRKITYEKDLK